MQAQRRVEKVFSRVVARSWHDGSYRRELLREPARVLRAAGLDVPEGVRVLVHQESQREMHVVLPARSVAIGESALDSGRPGPQLTCDPWFASAMKKLSVGQKPRVSPVKARAMTKLLSKWKTAAGKAAITKNWKEYKKWKSPK